MILAMAFMIAARPHAASVAHFRRRPAIVRHRPAPAAPPVRMDEIGITGGSTVYDGLAHTYTIVGHVKVTLQDMSVTCDKAVIHASPDESRVDTIDFQGDVVAQRDHNTFRGNDVTYFVAAKRLLALGDTVTKIRMPDKAAPARAKHANKEQK